MCRTCRMVFWAIFFCLANSIVKANFVDLNGVISRTELLDDIIITYTNPDDKDKTFTDPGIFTSLFDTWAKGTGLMASEDNQKASGLAAEKIKTALGTSGILSECSEAGCAMTRKNGYITLRDLAEVMIAKMIVNTLKEKSFIAYASIGSGRLFTDSRIFERVCKTWDGDEKTVQINFWDSSGNEDSFSAFKKRVGGDHGKCSTLTLKFYQTMNKIEEFKNKETCPAILVSVDMGGEGYGTDGAENVFIRLFYDCKDKIEDNLLVTPGFDVGDTGNWKSTEDFYAENAKHPKEDWWWSEKREHKRVRFVKVVKKDDKSRIKTLTTAGYIEKNDWPILQKSAVKKFEKLYNKDVAESVTTYVKDFVFNEKGLMAFKKALNSEELWFDPKAEANKIKSIKDEVALRSLKKVLKNKEWGKLLSFDINFLKKESAKGLHILHEIVSNYSDNRHDEIANTITDLVQHGFPIDEKNNDGKTVLFLAVHRPRLFPVILGLKPDVNKVDNNKQTAIFYATDPTIIGELLDAGVDVTAKDTAGDTIFTYFFKYGGGADSLLTFLRKKPTFTLPKTITYNEQETSLLYLALDKYQGGDDQWREVIKLLLKKGVDTENRYTYPGDYKGQSYSLKELPEASENKLKNFIHEAQKQIIKEILEGRLGAGGGGLPEPKPTDIPAPAPVKAEDQLVVQFAGALASVTAEGV